jgi:ATP-dependent DNA helicase RecG
VGRGIAYELSAEVQVALGQRRPARQDKAPAVVQAPAAPRPAAVAEPEPARPAGRAGAAPRAWREPAASEAQGPSLAEVRAVALALARERGRVRNVDLRETCRLSTQQAWRVLRRLVLDGQLVKTGTGTRDAAYELATHR